MANDYKSYKGKMMIGQAGVFMVAAKCLMRGHVPSFPSVDTGVDIVLDNGLRIQVKSSHLVNRKGHPMGAYCFSYGANERRYPRDWKKICDFFVYWGVSEDRFFVVPVEHILKESWIRPKGQTRLCLDVEGMRTLRDKGMTYKEIAKQFGISNVAVRNNLKSVSKVNLPGSTRHVASYEDRWDLLSISQALKEIEQSSATSEVNCG